MALVCSVASCLTFGQKQKLQLIGRLLERGSLGEEGQLFGILLNKFLSKLGIRTS